MRQDIKISIFLILIVALLSSSYGCAISRRALTKSTLSHDKYKDAFLLPVNFYKQEANKCAVAVLRSIFDYYDVRYQDVENIYDDKNKGTKLVTLVNYAERYFDSHLEHIDYEKIVKHLQKGEPLIILRRQNMNNHYYLVKGFLPDNKKLIVNDGYDENVILLPPNEKLNYENDITIILKQKRGNDEN